MYKIRRKDYLKQLRDTKRTLLAILRKEKYRGGVMICRHNSILCIKNTETNKIEMIIDTDKERGFVFLSDLNEHLAVPRYEPETAKEWMKEEILWSTRDDAIGHGDDEFTKHWRDIRVKVVLSEYQLREELKDYLYDRIEFLSALTRGMKEKGIEAL